MSDEVKVITDCVRLEAKKWRELSDAMEPIKSSVNDLVLGPTAFFIGKFPEFLVQHGAYQKFQSQMNTAVAGAVTEFDQLAGACDKMANEYDRTDQISRLDLDKIYTA
ncbi:hypothetical protein [Allorhizocola rhizosphaerae]|uniref:hypothetical protein n=1 Tax=Allorhizocola rhizosphaerae TaxID=1872709 RepID=UPI000E3C3E9F|nr:hypothetical protein [Allorhizocola rhizosphaerae]